MRPRDGAFGRRSPIRTLLSRDPLPVWRSVSAILPMSRQAVASTLGEPSPQLRKGRLSMTVSADSFDKLSEKIDSAKSAIRAAASQSEAELKAKVDEARKTADDRASELSVQTRTTGESVDNPLGSDPGRLGEASPECSPTARRGKDRRGPRSRGAPGRMGRGRRGRRRRLCGKCD